MIRNESVARMVMFLCFGTAVLSLAVHWRITTTQRQFEKLTSTAKKTQNSLYKGGLGEIAFGASTISGKSSPEQPVKKTFQSKSFEMKPYQNTQPVVTENKPKSLFSQIFERQKSSNRSGVSKMEVVVDLSDRRAYVYAGDLVMASYPIAIGKKGWETPVGSFQVSNMQHDPIWQHPITGQVFPPGTDSPLGDRWIGFWSDGQNQIGFHGTPDIHLLGAAISHGCLRMRNPDVRLLYDQVKVGTKVVVRD